MMHFPMDWQHALALFLFVSSCRQVEKSEHKFVRIATEVGIGIQFWFGFLYFVGVHAPSWWPL